MKEIRTKVKNIADEIRSGWEVEKEEETVERFTVWWDGYIACLWCTGQIDHEEEDYLLKVSREVVKETEDN